MWLRNFRGGVKIFSGGVRIFREIFSGGVEIFQERLKIFRRD